MGRLENKIAIITGAASGIGRATAIRFAEAGATVIATDLNFERVQETADIINNAGGVATASTLNVADREAWNHVVAETIATHGRIDILVNNAGMSTMTPFEAMTDEEWDKVMAVNTKSVFIGVQTVLPYMKETGGSIVNVASIAGLLGNCGSGPYSASKSALRSFASALAYDYAKFKIRVNNVYPGYIATDMTKDIFASPDYLAAFQATTPLPYLGEPDDIAYGILYLASDEAKFVTGTDLVIDGGVAMY